MHGIADYVYAPLTFSAPKIVGFEDEKNAEVLCQVIGAKVLASTMLTRAEWGVLKVVPFKAHLALDVVVSLFSFAAPWLFGFAKNTKARNTFLAMGAVGAVVTALTEPEEMPWNKIHSSDNRPFAASKKSWLSLTKGSKKSEK
jgi:hypothetical protein